MALAMDTVQSLLPLVSNALLIACTALILGQRWLPQTLHRISLTVLAFIASLIPFSDLSLAHYLAGLLGNLSITSLVLLGVYMACRCGNISPHETIRTDLNRLYLIVGTASIFLYPSALGFSQFDLYREGYYPIVLAPLVLSIILLGIFRSWFFLSTLLSAVFFGYGLGVFESSNLWDYLMDPLVAIFCLSRLWKAGSSLIHRISDPALQAAAVSFAGSFLLFSVFLSHFNHDAFRYQLTIEDGFTETITAVSLFLVAVICITRLVRLRRHRPLLFLGMIGFVGLAGLFGAGEEISWGQRVFGWETPEALLDYNRQAETGLHNLVVEVNDKKVSINKVIFGTGLALAMLIYLFVMTPLYRQHRARNGPFARLINRLAIPMPKNYQAIGYLIVVACVELLIDSSKRGEMTEFAGSIIFLLNVTFPDNQEIFDIDFEQAVS
ncbi:MAG: hypothetical protein CMQ20_13720 [Gammaproteobacteria bacterium]|jgi:hypothetical protein|nr:hypothetical protein [Gammaproteobacteria bacterium]|tara:strand:- start:415 stop:1731 length:1317 start_codon:yes stop_codon:yes gene_type:complete